MKYGMVIDLVRDLLEEGATGTVNELSARIPDYSRDTVYKALKTLETTNEASRIGTVTTTKCNGAPSTPADVWGAYVGPEVAVAVSTGAIVQSALANRTAIDLAWFGGRQ